MNKSYFRMYYYDIMCGEVNDILKGHEIIHIPDGILDKDLIQFLKKSGIIKKHLHNSDIDIDGDENTIYVNYKGIPDHEWRKIEEENISFKVVIPGIDHPDIVHEFEN